MKAQICYEPKQHGGLSTRTLLSVDISKYDSPHAATDDGCGGRGRGGGGELGAQAPPSSPDTKKYSRKNIKKPQKFLLEDNYSYFHCKDFSIK